VDGLSWPEHRIPSGDEGEELDMTKSTATLDANQAHPSDVRGTPRSRGRIASVLLKPSKLHLVLVVVLLLTTLGFAVWRSTSIRSLENEVAATRAQAHDAMTMQAGELLQLTAIPLAWAIRAGVVANDVRDIDMYMDKLVQEKYVKRIVFVDAEGVIVSSTNTKLEDQPAATALPGIDMKATTPRVDRAGDDLRIVVPVMSYERQVGTLVLDYSTSRSIETKLAPRS
jgi:hypothetical protein